MRRHSEVEVKLDASEGMPPPDLSGLCAAVSDAVTVQLVATYFDTADLRLARRDITLRRRIGGEDAGWHLKVPSGEQEKLELRLPPGPASHGVPHELLDEVRGIVRDQPVEPVAVLRTTRVERRLVGPDGHVMASVADDTVSAERLLPGEVAVSSWREVEVELVEGDRELLRSATDRLVEQGLTPSAEGSKLARALGPLPRRAAPTTSSLGPGGSAGDVLLAYVADQVDRLLSWDPGVRRSDDRAIHQMRTASRRLRSTLATYRPLLDRDAVEPVREELRWLGGTLGAGRDATVVHRRVVAALDELPAELVLGPVRRRVDLEMQERRRSAQERLVADLRSERYYRLMDALEALLDDPPLQARAELEAEQEVPRLVRRAVRRVDQAARRAEQLSGAARDLQLHEVRKCAKRARYAAESAVPVAGRPARRLATRMKAVQDALGEMQDAVTARETLRQLGVAAHLSGENGFTFGLLHAEEAHRAASARDVAAVALERASAKRVRAWLG